MELYIVLGVCVVGLLVAVIGGCCRKYTMKFDTNGVAFDEEITPIKARKGQEIELPELSSSKHEFLGWFLDPACTEKFEGKMRGDVVLYAGWKKKKEKKGPQPMNMSYTDYIMHNISFNIALDW
ncbi:MAG: InlB B-repeat-containing protein [Clostridia bacterium]|nr:InlB B-repeat-containing protein [Clostridia bacterium]